MPRSPDLAIFVLTTDDRRQTKPITLPLAHARGVNIASGKRLQRLFENTNGGRPDNGVSVCEGVYSRP